VAGEIVTLTARVNIEINLTGISSPDQAAPLHRSVAAADVVIATCEALADRVRQQILA
jgi:hypothetical protein